MHRLNTQHMLGLYTDCLTEALGGGVLCPHFTKGELRLTQVKPPVQGHTASKRMSQDSDPGPSEPKRVPYPIDYCLPHLNHPFSEKRSGWCVRQLPCAIDAGHLHCTRTISTFRPTSHSGRFRPFVLTGHCRLLAGLPAPLSLACWVTPLSDPF